MRRADIDRRRFLAQGAATTAALVAGSRLVAAAGNGPKVAVVRDKSEKAIEGQKVDAAIVQRLVDQAVMTVAGKDDAAKAWGAFVEPKHKVAVKFNGLFRNAATHPEVVQAVVKGLLSVGVEPGNIVVYDRDDRALQTAGLRLGGGVTARGTEKQFGKTIDECYAAKVKAGPVGTQLTKILMDADVLINVPMMKTHVLACVTGAMKNHLGTIPNAKDFHQDGCRFIGDLNHLGPIKDKTRLCICDALYGLYDGGPSFKPKFRWDYHGIVASADPVALDAILADILKAKRKEKGLSDYHSRGKNVTEVPHIARAAELNLGCADLKSIARIEKSI